MCMILFMKEKCVFESDLNARRHMYISQKDASNRHSFTFKAASLVFQMSVFGFSLLTHKNVVGRDV